MSNTMHIKPIIDKPENRLVKRFMSIEGIEFEDLTPSDSYRVDSISFSILSFVYRTKDAPNLSADGILVFVHFSGNVVPDNILDYVGFTGTVGSSLKKGPLAGTVLFDLGSVNSGRSLTVYSKADPSIKGTCAFRKLLREPEDGYDCVCEITVTPGSYFVVHTSGMYAREDGVQTMSFNTDSSLVSLKNVVFTMDDNRKTSYTAIFTAGNTSGRAAITSTSNYPSVAKRKWIVKISNSDDYIPIQSIKISPNRIDSLYVKNGYKTAEAIISPSNATYKDIRWRVPIGGCILTENTSLTTVKITAFKAGYSRLIAEDCDGRSGVWIPVYSQDSTVADDTIKISQKTLHLTSGESCTLSAEITHNGVTRPALSSEIAFESSNKSVATVAQNGSTKGRVVGVSTGIAVITVWISDSPSKKDTCTVYVNGGGDGPIPQPDPEPQPDPQPEPEPDVRPVLHVYSVSLSQASLNLRENESTTLIASVTDNGVTHTALQNEIVWKTSNSRIATVTRFGRATAKQLGECEIRAYLKVDSSVYATCKIIVEQSSAEDESHGGSTSPVVIVQNCLSFLLQKVKSAFSILLRRSSSSISSTITKIGEHLSTSIAKVVSNFSCSVIKESGKLSFTTKKASSKLQCTVGLVCGVSIGAPFGTRILWVSDGMLLTVDGGNFYVEKE